MKLGPVTKQDKRNTSTSKRTDNAVISENFDVIVFFPIYGQFTAVWKPDSGRMVYKTIFSSIVTFYFRDTQNITKKSVVQFLYYCFE